MATILGCNSNKTLLFFYEFGQPTAPNSTFGVRQSNILLAMNTSFQVDFLSQLLQNKIAGNIFSHE